MSPLNSLQIHLHQVSKWYGTVRALKGVTASLQGGYVSIIQGANGAGKSTLLAVVGTLLKPTSGKIDYGLLGRDRSEIRKKIGWLGEDLLCYTELSGRENIELTAQLYGLDPLSAFVSASERFNLKSFADRPLKACSQGQRQRVALARMWVSHPRVILLDEPTRGLDSDSVQGLVQILREEKGKGTLIAIATHDTEFAGKIGDEWIELAQGRCTNKRL